MRKRIIINDKGRPFIEAGQLWMYRNNLVSDASAADGEDVDLFSEDGIYLASGFYSAVSHICFRTLSKDIDTPFDAAFFKERLDKAISYRRQIMADQLDNCRMIFAEADGLPGLVADRYNDVIVTQISVSGIEKRKDMIYSLLMSTLKEYGEEVSFIYERNDIQARIKEGLQLYKGFYKEKRDTTETVITENGLKISVDFEKGQKTGYFLDQKYNRALIQQFARDRRVLDCFSHTCGFALNAAYGGAAEVTAVDVSLTALKQGSINAENNQLNKVMHFVQDDVFHYLKELKRGEYDLIILDPPAFTKSRKTIDHAYNGYKEINTLAMNALNDGALLASCSCSRYMEKENFEKMLFDAARDAAVTLKILSVSAQSPDHPIAGLNEKHYLKFYICQIIR